MSRESSERASDRAVAVVLAAGCATGVTAWGVAAVALTGETRYAVATIGVAAVTVLAGLVSAVALWWRGEMRADTRLDAYESSAVQAVGSLGRLPALPPDQALRGRVPAVGQVWACGAVPRREVGS